jgi:microcystin-dependent protein
MGLEAATYIGDLNTGNPVGSVDAKSQGDDHIRLLKSTLQATLPGLVGRAWRSQTKSGGYTVVANDNMSVLNCTTTLTLDLTAAATLANGHMFIAHANGGSVTIDPAGAELINGASTLVVPDGHIATVFCDGAAFRASIVQATNGTVSPAQITGNQNNYSPTGLAAADTLRISTDARRNITGLTGGSQGKRLTIHNVGTFPAVFKYEDGASTAANRFAFATTLGGGQSMEIKYDATSSRWRAIHLPEPLGVVKDFAGVLEDGFLAIDQNVSRTTYAALFNVIGTTFGAGDGSTTFGLFVGAGRALIAAGTGTTEEAVTSSSGNGFVVAANDKKWITGMAVVLSNLSGFTTSASAGPTYYVVRIGSTNVRLATTLALAQNGSPDITISGTGTATLTHTYTARTLGEYGGEESHAMSSTELLLHTHVQDSHTHTTPTNTSNVNAGSVVASGQNIVTEVNANITGSATVATNQNTGGNAAANIMQPFAVITRGIRYC